MRPARPQSKGEAAGPGRLAEARSVGPRRAPECQARARSRDLARGQPEDSHLPVTSRFVFAPRLLSAVPGAPKKGGAARYSAAPPLFVSSQELFGLILNLPDSPVLSK
jgi:hypothetical protein